MKSVASPSCGEPCTNFNVGCNMSVSSLESYNRIAAVDAVCVASSSEVGGVVCLDASENCKICCVAVGACV